MVYEVYISGRAKKDMDSIYHYYVADFSETSVLKVSKSL